jgi:hypothetical protein
MPLRHCRTKTDCLCHRQLLGHIGLGEIKRAVKEASRDDIALAARTVRSGVEFAVALHRNLEVTDSSALPPVAMLLAAMGRAIERLRIRPELAGALAAPVVLIVTPLLASARRTSPPSSKRLEELCTTFSEAAAQIRAMTRLAETLPPQWRACFGHNGLVHLAKLAPNERDEVLAASRDWLQISKDPDTAYLRNA